MKKTINKVLDRPVNEAVLIAVDRAVNIAVNEAVLIAVFRGVDSLS